MKTWSVIGLLFGAAIFATIPISPQVTPSGVELSVDQAQAYYGHYRRVHRRVYRRAYRRGYYYGARARNYYGALTGLLCANFKPRAEQGDVGATILWPQHYNF